MSEWRIKTDGTTEMEKNLTDGDDFDWVGYLKSHPDTAVIVPDGKVVVSFSIARLAVIDRNTQSGRVDFVVLLDDGHRVRLHPSQKQEARPIIVPPDRAGIFMLGGRAGREAVQGTLVEVERGTHVAEARAAQPGVAEARAAQPGVAEACAAQPGPLGKNKTHFKVASEADLLMPSQVRRWLAERAELWPAVKFCQDITRQLEPLAPRSDPLPWHLLVAGVPELKAMQPFEAVFVVWVDGPALYFRGLSGDEVVVDLGVSGMKGVTLHRDRVPRCRWHV
jgi:hypothetical protein